MSSLEVLNDLLKRIRAAQEELHDLDLSLEGIETSILVAMKTLDGEQA